MAARGDHRSFRLHILRRHDDQNLGIPWCVDCGFTLNVPLRRRAVMRDVGIEDRLPAAFAKPSAALLFELVFGDHQGVLTVL